MFYGKQSVTASDEAVLNLKDRGKLAMKNKREIRKEQIWKALRLGVLTLTMATLLCLPLITPAAGAQKHANHVGWYSGMSYLAEQEIRAEQKKAIAEKEKGETHITTNTNVDVDDNEEDHSNNCRLILAKEGTKC
jgi:hypothetical protein